MVRLPIDTGIPPSKALDLRLLAFKTKVSFFLHEDEGEIGIHYSETSETASPKLAGKTPLNLLLSK